MKSLKLLKDGTVEVFADMLTNGGATQISEDAVLCLAACSSDYGITPDQFDTDDDIILITGLHSKKETVSVINEESKSDLLKLWLAIDDNFERKTGVSGSDNDLARIDAAKVDYDAANKEIDDVETGISDSESESWMEPCENSEEFAHERISLPGSSMSERDELIAQCEQLSEKINR